MDDIYDIQVKDSLKKDISLSEYSGKTLLVVNVASKCGLTPQYEGLQELYDRYKDRNFVVLGFPCNQFAHPLFKLLKRDKPGIFRTQSIKWNFTKFLINSNGKIVERFSPRVEPKYIKEQIERIL